MRIETLRLDDWGSFEQAELPLGAGLVVVHGANEAGKSTLQRALTSLLFGIPARSVNDAWRVGDRKKLRLGAHVSFSDGTAIDVRRSHHRAPADVRGADDEPLEGAARHAFDRAVDGLDASAFERLFALDHARLRAGGDELAQQEGSLGETLFAAASGIVDLRGVLTDLRSDRDGLYNGLRKGVLFNEVGSFRTATAELVRDRGDVDRLGDLRATRTRLRTRLEQAAGERARIGGELVELVQLTAARPYLDEWRELQERRHEAGARPSLDARAATRISELVAARARDQATSASERSRLTRLDAQASDLASGSMLAGLADRAGALVRSSSAAAAAERQHESATTRLTAARTRLAALELPDADAAARLRAALAAARGADVAHVRRTTQELLDVRPDAAGARHELASSGVELEISGAAHLGTHEVRSTV
ncbi:MAG: AAA family ATPase, partial [Thermoleophilia bacterium]|nr:AAA family ATPase [Thermoleophilia bacterium]